MTEANTDDVKSMYSRYPYPSPVVDNQLIYDVATLLRVLLPGNDLAGKQILDAGCGTSHRLIASAKRFPKAQFTGIDMTRQSISVGQRLVEQHRVTNVQFEVHNLLTLEMPQKFDLIISTGVIHHLEDPERGLRNLCRHLTNSGAIIIWHYHPFGEFHRLLERDLVRTLWMNKSDLVQGIALMTELQLTLDSLQYGSTASQQQKLDRESALSVNVDAYLHPIVNAYRFQESIEMFADCEVQWVALNGFNAASDSKLIDLEEVGGDLAYLSLSKKDLFRGKGAAQAYDALSRLDKLKVIELIVRPTGFTVIAGKDGSLLGSNARLMGNRTPFQRTGT
jgi:SAM-dependent methyltransferase